MTISHRNQEAKFTADFPVSTTSNKMHGSFPRRTLIHQILKFHQCSNSIPKFNRSLRLSGAWSEPLLFQLILGKHPPTDFHSGRLKLGNFFSTLIPNRFCSRLFFGLGHQACSWQVLVYNQKTRRWIVDSGALAITGNHELDYWPLHTDYCIPCLLSWSFLPSSRTQWKCS
jgi:hypothetical protein